MRRRGRGWGREKRGGGNMKNELTATEATEAAAKAKAAAKGKWLLAAKAWDVAAAEKQGGI